MASPDTTVLVTGHAKPVKEDAINYVYDVLSLSLLVDTGSDRIVDVACTMVMDVSARFVHDLLVGRSIVTEMDQISASIRSRFLSLAQKPLLVALRDAQNRYLVAFPDRKTVS